MKNRKLYYFAEYIARIPSRILLLMLVPFLSMYAVYHFDRFWIIDDIKSIQLRLWLAFSYYLGNCFTQGAGWYVRKTSYGNGPRKWFWHKPRSPWMIELWFVQR